MACPHLVGQCPILVSFNPFCFSINWPHWGFVSCHMLAWKFDLDICYIKKLLCTSQSTQFALGHVLLDRRVVLRQKQLLPQAGGLVLLGRYLIVQSKLFVQGLHDKKPLDLDREVHAFQLLLHKFMEIIAQSTI